MSIKDKLITIAQNQEKVHYAGQLSVIKDNENLKGTASGTAVSINDASPVQHDVKISVSSKNILDAKTLASYNNGTEYVADGESFTLRGNAGDVNGAASGQLMIPYCSASNIAQNGFDVEVGATYTVSFNAQILEVGNNGNGIAVLIYYTGGSTVSVLYTALVTITENTNNRYSFKFTPTKNFKHAINFRVNNNLMTISNIQIEKSSTDTPFTPYLVDTSAIGVKRWGKNLLPLSPYAVNHQGLTIEYIPEEDCLKFNGSVESTTLNKDVVLYPYILRGEVGAKYTLSIKHIDGTIEYPQGTSGRYSNMFLYTSNNLPTNIGVARTSFIEMNRLTQGCYLTKTATLTQPYFWGFRFYITKDVIFTDAKIKI